MRLYKILAQNIQDYFGTREERIERPGITMIDKRLHVMLFFLYVKMSKQ